MTNWQQKMSIENTFYDFIINIAESKLWHDKNLYNRNNDI